MLNKLIIFEFLLLNLTINGILAKLAIGSCPNPPNIPRFTIDKVT